MSIKKKEKKKRKIEFIIFGTIFITCSIALIVYVENTNQSANKVDIKNQETEVATKDDDPGKAERIARRVKEMKWNVVSKIQACESGGYTEADAPIVYDSNEKVSIGVLQWQIESIQHYVKKWEDKEISRKEAIILALDADRARELAYKTIWREVGGIHNWAQCRDKTNVVPKIELIRKLTEKS